MLDILDAILGLICVEGGILSFVYIKIGCGISPRNLAPNLAAGFFLLLAARLGLSGAPAWAPGASLFAALLAHTLDLRQRWRKGASRPRLDP